jgi:hypothetical protein
MKIERIFAAACVVLVSTAIVGFSTGSTGASFTGSSTNPNQSWNTQNVTPPAAFTSATPVPAGQIDLVWTATTSPAGSHTLTYLVLRGPVGGPYAQVGTTAGLTYSDIPASDGTYEYVVQTKIAQGTGFFTSGNSATKSSLSDRTAPTTVSGLTQVRGAVGAPVTANLAWTAGTDGGTGVGGYVVHWSNPQGGACPAISGANYPNSAVIGVVTSYQISGLVSGSKYCSYLVTTDVAGNSSANSAVVSSTAR